MAANGNKKHGAAKRRNQFHHHIGKARVWARRATANRHCKPMRDGFLAMACKDRAVAFAWLRGEQVSA